MNEIKDFRLEDLKEMARSVALPRFTMYNIEELKAALSERKALLSICADTSTYSLRTQVSNRIMFTPYGIFISLSNA